MALLQVHYLSECMRRIVTFHIYLPNDIQEEFTDGNPHYDRPTKTLFLLHGYSGNTVDWVCGSQTMELSRQYNLAIVMPSGENSFYIDRKPTGQKYETYIGKELVEYVSKTFGLSSRPEDVFIGGLSMGGFGAIRLAAKFPETFGAAFGLSSAMIMEEISELTADTKEGFPLVLANYEYYEDIFGDLAKVRETEADPAFLIRQNKENGIANPPFFMACGTEDALLENNRRFRDFLLEQGEDLTYCESKGIHNWTFWSEYLEPAVLWALKKADPS